MRMYVTTEDVLWLAGAIVAISAAIKVVCGAIEQFRKPNKTQDARIAELERKAVNDYNRLNQLEEGNIITQRALLALLAHGIDGNDKITHVGKRTTRDKLLSYLSAESVRQSSLSFDIPFNRQQLADYLCIDRAAMSAELSKLQKEGLIKTNRKHFELTV